MIKLLGKLFIENKEQGETERRRRYGILCSIVGIGLNILLFAGKLLAGILSGAVSITADAFNNLSDAGSSVITLTGFKLAGQKPDKDHPFGFGRIEYIAGFIVSLIIMLVGFELLKSSVEKIFSPEEIEFSLLSVSILAVSMLVKLYMALYNSRYGKKFDSAAMKATAADSLSDVCATGAVLAAFVIAEIFHIQIDAYCGAAVSLIILWNGIKAAKETVDPLLGNPPEEDFVKEVEKTVMAHEGVKGIHDLMVHDYGPGRRVLSLHAEVPADGDILKLHDMIDNIEQELSRELGCFSVIHMDPISVGDPETEQYRETVTRLVAELSPAIRLHDFRIVKGDTHTNLIFDLLIPYGEERTDEETVELLKSRISACGGDKKLFAVIHVDKPFVS